MAPDVESVSAETTARMVATATAATKPSMRSPPKLPLPPPRYCASSGSVRLPPLSAARSASWPTKSAAARPNSVVPAKKAPARKKHHPHHRAPRGPGIRNGIKSRHHVRQSGKAKRVTQPERYLVERILQIIAG